MAFAGLIDLAGSVPGEAEASLRARIPNGRVWPSEPALLVHASDCGYSRPSQEPQILRGDSGLALTFDGRLDNRDDLIPLLDLPPAVHDERIVLSVLERWGRDGLAKLIGDFVLAAWDTTHRTLLLATSPLGRRPLFIHRQGQRIAFSTQPSALLALPQVSRRVNLKSVAAYLMDRHPGDGESFFEGIASLPASTWATFSPSETKQEQYWRPGGERPTLRLRRDEDYVEAAREVLSQVVGIHLNDDAPTVALATGGLDSSTVAATAARLRAPETVHILTAIPRPGAPLPPSHPLFYDDETPFVQALADLHPNMRLHLVPGTGLHPLELDPTPIFELAAMPMLKVVNIFWFDALNQYAKTLGARAILTGTSGNITLSWFGNQTLIALLRRGRLLRVARELTLLGKVEGVGFKGALRQEVLGPLRRKQSEWRLLSDVSGIAPGFAQEVGGITIRPIPSGWKVTAREMRRAMLEGQSRSGAMMEAWRQWQGIESLDPLGDPRMIDFCLSLPDEQAFKDGVRRRLARRVAADRSSPLLYNNRMRGNQCPEWFSRIQGRREEFAAVLEQLERSPLASHCLDLPLMRRIIENWPADAAAAERRGLAIRGILLRGNHLGRFLLWAEGLAAAQGV